MPQARAAVTSDLDALLALFERAPVSAHATPIEAAQAVWAQRCFHVMLQSGRLDPGVHRFYERQGFEGGLRVACTVNMEEKRQCATY